MSWNQYHLFTGIIQKKSASDSRALPILVFDEKKNFQKNSVILRHFWVKLQGENDPFGRFPALP